MSVFERLQRFYLPPLAAGCVFFCLGILAQSHFKMPAAGLFVLLGVLLSLGLLFLKRRRFSEGLLAGMAFLFGVLILASHQPSSGDPLFYLASQGARQVTLQGIVVSDPGMSGRGTSFLLSASRLKSKGLDIKVCGVVSVRFYGKEVLCYGDEILAQGSLYNYRSRFNLSVKNAPGALRRTGRRGGFWVKRWALAGKHKIKAVIVSRLSPFYASVLLAMVLGENRDISPLVREAMIRTGTWHVLVVSGSHTALVAFMLLIFLKILRVPRKLRFVLVMALLGAYCFMTGARAPVVRSTVMAQAFLSGFLIGRKPLFYNSLALAAWVILAFDPFELFRIGFQLSFLSVIFIVGLSLKMRGLFPQRWLQRSRLSFVIDVFCVSLSAWLGTLPLLVCAFGRFSGITVLANMVVVPLAMAITAGGFALALAAVVFPALSPFIGLALEFLLALFFHINFFLSRIPGSSFTFSSLPWAVALVYYALILLLACVFSRKPA